MPPAEESSNYPPLARLAERRQIPRLASEAVQRQDGRHTRIRQMVDVGRSGSPAAV